MSKRKEDADKELEKLCERYGIDPDWYDTKRELYKTVHLYQYAECARKRRGSAKREQNKRIKHKPILDKNGETNIPQYKPDRRMWD